jgi:hypothetical protein
VYVNELFDTTQLVMSSVVTFTPFLCNVKNKSLHSAPTPTHAGVVGTAVNSNVNISPTLTFVPDVPSKTATVVPTGAITPNEYIKTPFFNIDADVLVHVFILVFVIVKGTIGVELVFEIL